MNAGVKGANQTVAAPRLGGNITLVTKIGNDILENKQLTAYKKKTSIPIWFVLTI